jgi:hypothetical protein
MRLSIRKTDLILFAYWVAAAIAGRLIYTTAEIGLDGIVTSAIAFAAISAVLRAGTQWLALQDEFPYRGQWFAATFIGILLNGIAINQLDDVLLGLIERINPQSLFAAILVFASIQAAQGAFMGFFQWLVLRLEAVRAGWWVAIMALANGLSTAAFIGLNVSGFASSNAYIVPALVTVVNAVVSGIGLVWLLNERWEDEDGEPGEDQPLETEAAHS